MHIKHKNIFYKSFFCGALALALAACSGADDTSSLRQADVSGATGDEFTLF